MKNVLNQANLKLKLTGDNPQRLHREPLQITALDFIIQMTLV